MDGIENGVGEAEEDNDDCMMAIASPKLQIEAAHIGEIGPDQRRNGSSSIRLDDPAD